MQDNGKHGRSDDSAGLAARALALRLIAGVRRDKRMLSDLEQGPDWDAAVPSDRARAARLTRATLRMTGRAQAALRPHMRRPPPPPIFDILHLATVEMLGEGTAPHGAVHDAVTLARKAHPRSAGMVNAVLRKVAAEGRAPWDNAGAKRLPGWLRGRLSAAYGNRRVAQMEAVFESVAPLDLTPKDAANAASLAEATGGTLLPTGSVRLVAPGAVSALPGYDAGAWWVQDAAATLAAPLLAVGPGQTAIDLCAAPGGKTMQLAATGAEVTAVDSAEPRLARLRENLNRIGLDAHVVAADAATWRPDVPADAVLLDAPCSATGTIRRHPDLPELRDASGLKALASLQAALIDAAREMVAPGGTLVYCTCSLLPEEGEAQIAAALARHADLSLLPIDGVDPVFDAGPGQMRITPEMWPESGGLDGFFIARLRRA